jgi:hypothetical protein
LPCSDSQREVEPQVQNPQQTELQSQTQTLPEIEDDIEFEDDISDATALKSLLFHVRMNSIADYYDIPELRQCASTEAQNILNTSWSPCNFPIVIQEVFKSTGDKELRDILSDATAAHMDELVELGGGIAPPEVISDFAYNVLRKLVVASKSRIEDLESQLHEAKRQAQLTVRAHESTKRNIEKFSRLFNTQRCCCRNSGFSMVEVDPREDSPSYKLCCRSCSSEYTC